MHPEAFAIVIPNFVLDLDIVETVDIVGFVGFVGFECVPAIA